MPRDPLSRLLGTPWLLAERSTYVVPVGIAYKEDYIYVFSTMGQKIKWMRSNPKVCVQIDEIRSQSDWVSVIANGEYQELPEPQFEHERAHARTLLQKRHHWWLNAMGLTISPRPSRICKGE